MRTHDDFGFDDESFWQSERFYGRSVDTNILGPQAMSQADAEKIARNYMQVHYPDPGWLNKVNVFSHTDGGNKPTDASFTSWYKFEFYQAIDGVRTPSKCDIMVDTIFGKIISFWGIHYPLLVSTIPALTVDQAYACALQTLQTAGTPSGEPELIVTIPDGMGVEQLVYRLQVAESMSSRLYRITLNANTGVVCSVDKAHGNDISSSKPIPPAILTWQARLAKQPAVAKTVLTPLMGETKAEINYPPLLIDNQPYLYVGYLCYGAKDVKLKYGGRDDIAIVSAGRNARFSLNRAAYTLNGQTRALPARPVIVQDRCYVPLRAAQDTMPFRIAYDAAKKQVRFDALPDPPKTAAVKESEAVFGGKR